MAYSIVASHTRGSSTYGLPNEAGDARHRSRWPHQHTPGSATSYTPSRIFAYWHIIYAVRIWAEGASSRNRAAPVAFVFEVFTKTQYVELYYVEDTGSRRCVDFYFAGRVVEYVTHCHEPPRTRAHAALVSCMWPLSQPALTLDSPHLACPLALPRHIRSRHKRTHARRTTRVRLSRAILPSSVHECDMDCEGMRMFGGMRCLS
jgi:hypothetical protein